MATIIGFFEAFQYSYMRYAFLSAIIIGVVCSLIGVFVLLRGLVFLGEAIAHSAFAGAALAILVNFDPIISIIGFSLLSALSIGFVNRTKIMKDEVIIGIVFSFFMALAILFIGLHREYSSDINSILFGNILLVDRADFILLIVFSIAILLLTIFLKKELYYITFDSELAQISGIPVNLISFIFLIMLSFTISVSLKAIGAILVFAMIITPAAAAFQWTFKLRKMMLLSIGFGIFSTIFGLFFSYLLDIPSGASIVTLITIVFLTSFIFSPKRRSMKKHFTECPFCKEFMSKEGHCTNPKCTFGDVLHRHVDEELNIRKDDVPIKEATSHEHETTSEEDKKDEGEI